MSVIQYTVYAYIFFIRQLHRISRLCFPTANWVSSSPSNSSSSHDYVQHSVDNTYIDILYKLGICYENIFQRINAARRTSSLARNTRELRETTRRPTGHSPPAIVARLDPEDWLYTETGNAAHVTVDRDKEGALTGIQIERNGEQKWNKNGAIKVIDGIRMERLYCCAFFYHRSERCLWIRQATLITWCEPSTSVSHMFDYSNTQSACSYPQKATRL